ncbi:universal stress protein [Halorhabdus sp. BNX81]|uniref:universal stress protein n=1 Tax=Halorhabdus sp. BNX81 TaxID=2980181 RepID=UPI0023DD12D9|nr:universal stress protein [Halorhabdus sp. BNX81]WEL21371.1 Nucleotide-binding protein, UspA family [Halorhabdus sp. BNX81]
MKAVYATDLSEASEATIANETCLACLDRIGIEEFHLVTVVPSNVHSGMPGMNFEKRRQRALDRYRKTFEDAGFGVETHVVRGTPHRRINGIAESVGASLSIVGSRGSSPLENRLIGSTARNLARTSVTPLLVNRIQRATEDPAVLEDHLFERMLYATDFSENAQEAFEAFSYLRYATKEATLVHVRTPADPDLDAAPREQLDELADQLAEWDIETRIAVRDGDPVEEILAAEGEYDPTTTLVGSRGHSRLRRLLLGSVSEDVVAKADGNVLVVPPKRVA